MRDGEIFLCFDCGAKNRIRPGIPGVPKCGSCGATLRPSRPGSPASPVPEEEAAPGEEKRQVGKGSGSRKQPDDGVARWLLPLGLGAAMFVLPYLAHRQDQQATEEPGVVVQPSPAPEHVSVPAPAVEEPQPVLLPVYEQPGIMYNNTGRPPLAPLKIVTKHGHDHYVKLVEMPRGLDAVGIYVKGGQKVDILVPLGSYELRSASGKTWYGIDNLFGPQTTCEKAWERFQFTEERRGYRGYTIELIAQQGGNMRTSEITPGEF